MTRSAAAKVRTSRIKLLACRPKDSAANTRARLEINIGGVDDDVDMQIHQRL
jgi:hypothetical protein